MQLQRKTAWLHTLGSTLAALQQEEHCLGRGKGTHLPPLPAASGHQESQHPAQPRGGCENQRCGHEQGRGEERRQHTWAKSTPLLASLFACFLVLRLCIWRQAIRPRLDVALKNWGDRTQAHIHPASRSSPDCLNSDLDLCHRRFNLRRPCGF